MFAELFFVPARRGHGPDRVQFFDRRWTRIDADFFFIGGASVPASRLVSSLAPPGEFFIFRCFVGLLPASICEGMRFVTGAPWNTQDAVAERTETVSP